MSEQETGEGITYKDIDKLPQFLLTQSIVIGVLFTADQIFGFFEQNFFNTYLDHVLGLSAIYISLMVTLSAIMGLIFNMTWGIKSDNTRSKYGRRRPFLLLGGTVSGTAMILYAFSPNYFWAIFFDVIIIGVFSNMYFSSQRALIPDIIPQEYRGRANGIITVFGNIGILVAVAFFLIANELFTVKRGTGNVLTQVGHIFVLSVGGAIFIFCGILGFLKIREPPVEEMPPVKKFGEELKEFFDLEEMKKQTEFFKNIGAYSIFKTGVNTVMPFLFIFIFALGLTTIELLIGIAISFPLLMLCVLGMGRLSDKFGRKKFIPIFLLIISIGYFIMPFSFINDKADITLFYIALPFVLVGVLGVNAPLDAWSQDLLPQDKRGKFLGIYNFIWVISQIIGSFIGALVVDYIGISWIFLFGAFFMLLSIPFFLQVKETLEFE